jgi:predicted nucleic-acid-binding protein
MSVKKASYLVDTNILLRFLTDDEPRQSPAAKELFEQAQAGQVTLCIPFITIADTVFKLERHYGIERAAIGRELLKIVNAQGVVLFCPAWIIEAIEGYRVNNVSFGDACLAAEAKAEGLPVASFDKGLSKFAGLVRFEPGAG